MNRSTVKVHSWVMGGCLDQPIGGESTENNPQQQYLKLKEETVIKFWPLIQVKWLH